MDAAGQGEAVVAVRSGLVAGDTLTLYAGAGIVAGMDPDVLVAETELKFRVLGDLFS
jgi:isochorismate synthase EntC